MSAQACFEVSCIALVILYCQNLPPCHNIKAHTLQKSKSLNRAPKTYFLKIVAVSEYTNIPHAIFKFHINSDYENIEEMPLKARVLMQYIIL